MANLLDEASILLTPTAYNNGSMLAVKPENGDGDMTFSRNSAATRVNAQGLVENVQILSSNLVSNGDFSQEGSQLITNGFFATDTDWTKQTSWSISGGSANYDFLSDSKYIRQTLLNGGFVAGKTYKINFEITSGTAYINVNSNGGGLISLNTYSVGSYSIYVTPSISASDLLFYGRNTSGTAFSITNISVKEVGQNWTLGTGWSIGDGVVINDGTSGSSDSLVYTAGFPTISSKTYELSVVFDSYDITNSNAIIAMDSGAIPSSYNRVIARQGDQDNIVNGVYKLNFIASSSTVFKLYSRSGATATISSISLIEITDDTNLPRINYEGFSYQDSLGSEEIVNGDFATDSNWIKNGQVTIGGGVAYFDSDGTFTQIAQSISGVSGKNVKVVIEITEYTQGTLKVLFSGGTQQNLPNSIGVHTLYFNNADSDTINIARLGGVTNLKIDNVSVKEYLGQEIVPNSGCGSWLLEPQSTNLITQSENLSSSWSFINVDKTLTQVKNPSGNLGIYEIAANSTSGLHWFEPTTYNATSGVDYTFSFFAKINGSNFVQVALSTGFSSLYQNFNLLDGTLGNGDLTSGYSSNIEPFGNGWYRISVTGNTISANARFLTIPILTDIASRNPSFVGDGTLGIYVWGFQKEQNSYPTSYIPTQGAISTRLQDIANNSGNASLINSEEGVLYAEISALANDGTSRVISLSDSSDTNRVHLFYNISTNTINLNYRVAGSSKAVMSFALSDVTIMQKIAYKWESGNFVLFVNGVNRGTSTNTVMMPVNTMNQLAFNVGGGSSPFYGKTKAIAVYKTALTDEQLTALTTI